MTRHQLSKLDLLGYALMGACVTRNRWSDGLNDRETEKLHKDIAEIERRIKLVKAAEQRAERNKQ